MSLPSTQHFFDGITHLPAMPEVAQQLLATFSRDNASMGELAELVSRDAALSARLLRLANAARYAPNRHVSRLQEAAMLIGLGALRGLAMAAVLADSFPNPSGFDRLRFWRQNLATAGYARWLATHLELDAGLAEVAGMLLRSGQVLMLLRDPGMTALVEGLTATPDSVFELERLHFGCTHADLSAELALRWRFPNRIVDALATAGDPVRACPFSPEGAALRAASVMADAAEDGFDPLEQLQACQPALVHGLGLALDEWGATLPDYARLIAPAASLLG